jgi:transaldolase
MIKLFADGADKAGMLEMYQNPRIDGFTTNPTLMRIAGISDYVTFAKNILQEINDKPVSFEVFADEFPKMKRQALEIASWGSNVYVKIPITNTNQESSAALIRELAAEKVKLNITAILSLEQVKEVARALNSDQSAFVSVFAGRIADTGRDPIPYMKEALQILKPLPKAELLWASPREVLNVYQADSIGCHIITATNSILKKLNLKNKDLGEYSLDTVKMFYRDAKQAGYTL